MPDRSTAGVTTRVVLSSPVGGATSRATTMKRVFRSGRSSMPAATVTSPNSPATRVGAMATRPSSELAATSRHASVVVSAYRTWSPCSCTNRKQCSMPRGLDTAVWAASAASAVTAKASRLSDTTTSSRMKAFQDSKTSRSYTDRASPS